MPKVNNKRIAKNTIMLYIRMLLIMAVSLYTTRVVLSVLGVEDYGIYNLIGGFISIFSIISNSLVSAVQRFFNIALGKDDGKLFGNLYITGINLLIILSVFIIIVAETVGVWFVKTQLNIPAGREDAAFWVFQISVVTLIVTLFRTPDNAAIIAHEKMSFYAVLSIAEVIVKLAIVFILSYLSFDKLILYTLLYLSATVIINIAYKLYCNAKFGYCRYRIYWNGSMVKDMLSFSWWTLVGKGVQLGTLQGENFFLNHYYSVSVNAARGIASQVYNAINTFLVNFQTAFRPQLVQTYVQEEKKEHLQLLFRSARMSFYLLLVISIPILFNLDVLLSLWLEEVPLYTKEFCVFVLFAYLVDALSMPLATTVSANGNIKSNQIMISAIFILQLICSFFALRMRVVPYVVSIFILCSHSLMFCSYLYYAHKLSAVSYRTFSHKVLLPCTYVLVLSMTLPYIMSSLSNDWLSALLIIAADIVWAMLIVWLFGLEKSEKGLVLDIIKSKLHFNK